MSSVNLWGGALFAKQVLREMARLRLALLNERDWGACWARRRALGAGGDKGVEGKWMDGWMPYVSWSWVRMLLNWLVNAEKDGETLAVGPTGLLTSCWRRQWVVRQKERGSLTCGTHERRWKRKRRG